MQMHEAEALMEAKTLQAANKALNEGWKLLAITSGTHPEVPELTSVVYVLGRKNKKADPLAGGFGAHVTGG